MRDAIVTYAMHARGIRNCGKITKANLSILVTSSNRSRQVKNGWAHSLLSYSISSLVVAI